MFSAYLMCCQILLQVNIWRIGLYIWTKLQVTFNTYSSIFFKIFLEETYILHSYAQISSYLIQLCISGFDRQLNSGPFKLCISLILWPLFCGELLCMQMEIAHLSNLHRACKMACSPTLGETRGGGEVERQQVS